MERLATAIQPPATQPVLGESAPLTVRAHRTVTFRNPGTEEPHTILVVDGQDAYRQLLRGILKTEPCRIVEVARPSDALLALESRPVDLVLADLAMPEISGLEFCRRLKSNRRTRFIPLVLIAGTGGAENEIASLESGADEFFVRPLQPVIVRTRIRTLLRNKRAVDSLEEAEAILFALAHSVECRDRDTGDHCGRLAALSVRMGRALGLPEKDLQALERGGYLHDIGKVSVPDSILHKRGPLTDEEWRIMRAHPVQGEAICRPMRSLANVLPIIRSHHERWDGSGYPDRLHGEEIPLLARILQLSDIYDALRSRRSYKRSMSHQQALLILRDEARRGWRDPDLTQVFCELLSSDAPIDYDPRVRDILHLEERIRSFSRV